MKEKKEKITDNGLLSNSVEYGPEEYGIDELDSQESFYKSERIDGYLVSDIELCVVNNTEYYLNKFRKLPAREINESAFLCSINWMAYRHMWREGIILYFLHIIPVIAAIPFLVRSALNGRAVSVDAAMPILLFSTAVYCYLTGLFGDTIYWKKIKRELDRFNRKNSTVPMTEAEIEELQHRTQCSYIYVGLTIILYQFLEKAILYIILLIEVITLRLMIG